MALSLAVAIRVQNANYVQITARDDAQFSQFGPYRECTGALEKALVRRLC